MSVHTFFSLCAYQYMLFAMSEHRLRLCLRGCVCGCLRVYMVFWCMSTILPFVSGVRFPVFCLLLTRFHMQKVYKHFEGWYEVMNFVKKELQKHSRALVHWEFKAKIKCVNCWMRQERLQVP